MQKKVNLSFQSRLRKSAVLTLFVIALVGSGAAFDSDTTRALARRQVSVTDTSVPLGNWIYNSALDVFNNADKVHYEHQAADATQQVTYSGKRCDAECDCSGFLCYVINKVAPEHYESLTEFDRRNSGHAQAKTFERFFETLSYNEPQNGWQRVAAYKDLMRGDLIAWEKTVTPEAAASLKKGNTGHVMIVESPAGDPQTATVQDKSVRYVEVPVIDSSSVDHFPPEQLPPHAHQDHRDGIGRGVVRLILDQQGLVCGYWEGTYWNEGGKKITKPSYSEHIAFARLLHETK